MSHPKSSSARLRVLTHLPVRMLESVVSRVPGIELIEVPWKGDPDPEVRGDVLLTQAWRARNLVQALDRGVRWVHAFGTGVDRYPLELMRDVVFTCSRGAGAIPISEWVLAMMLAFAKRLPGSWVSEPPEHWNAANLGALHGSTLGLVGLGGIGTAVATRALAFGMHVRAVRRTPAPSPVAGVEIVPDLEPLVASAHHLVVAAPSTPDTRGLIDRAALAHAGPGLHVVNIARGSLIDLESLREALDDGRVARASLDTVEPEPLPEGHWLYTHPRVRLSPHISWSMPGALDHILEPFIENLQRYRAGEPLEGVVDVDAGY